MAGFTPHCVAHVSVDSERSKDRAYIRTYDRVLTGTKRTGEFLVQSCVTCLFITLYNVHRGTYFSLPFPAKSCAMYILYVSYAHVFRVCICS